MSDHGHHDPGGHELEAVNTKVLFRLLISLSFVTLLASIAVIQWFNSQRRALAAEYDAQGSFRLQSYQDKMGTALEGIDGVAKDIAANPKLLAAPAPPDGWVHPDDLVGGGAAAPTEDPAAAEDKPAAPAPAEGDAAEGDAAEGDAAEGDAAEGDAAEGDAAEGDAAEGDAAEGDAAADKPAADEPADKPKSNNGDNGQGQDKPKSNNGNNGQGQDKPKSNNGQGQPDNG